MEKSIKEGVLIPVIIFEDEDAASYCHESTFDDNGGETDGKGYVATTDNISRENLELLIGNNTVEINNHGVMISNYNPNCASNQMEEITGMWTGWSSTGIAYFEDEESADAYYKHYHSIEENIST